MEAYLTTDCADLLIFWNCLGLDILYSIHWHKPSFMKFDTNAQDAFTSKFSIFGVAKKGLIIVLVSVFFATACKEKSNERPSRVDAPPAKSAEDQIELVYCQPSDLHKLTVLFRIRSAVAVQTNGDESSLWA